MFTSDEKIKAFLNNEDINENYDLLDGDDYDRGQLEAVEGRAKNNSDTIQKLIKALYKKGTLSEDEAVQIISEYGSV